jgi:hypothetical protein
LKRFTETEKWNDPWYMSLTPTQKLAWEYITDRCDCSGVWDRNDILANCQIGAHVDWDDALKAFGDGRVRVLPNGKWLILSFIAFQYGKLSSDCPPHRGIIAKLTSHGLNPLGLAKGSTTLQEKEKDKEKDKEKGKGIGKGEGKSPVARRIDTDLAREQGGNPLASRRPTIETLLLYAAKIGLPENEVHRFWDHYESNGWKVGKNPMRSYEGAMRNWKRNWDERRAALNGRPIGQQTLIDKELDRL